MKIKILRPAIAMIELIFAIVVMGIVLMSAPMLISTATQSTFVALQQEGINEAASRVNMVMGYAWDEQNTQENYLFPILHVTSGDSAFDESGTTARRVGTPMASQRTFILSDVENSDLNASTTLGSEGGDLDDIDDFGGTSLANIEAATIDYAEKATVNIATSIAYTGDGVAGGYNQSTVTFVPFAAPGGTTTNIKSITVNLTSTSGIGELQKDIMLRAFTCNIGGYKLEERSF
ncbi:type II secretion system protein [Sulfurovum sp.]|uniref:type II secretion system protein n=1 Tax=Sulfurovum sp. TaxID=1969726 RepID=UPI003564F57E